MMIEFLCPNGHKIRCPEERAGLPAKCPKCGVKFRVPDLSLDESSTADTERSAVGQANGVAAGNAPAATAEQQIEFLCPNGHRLHGPASLQGRPGQCPECGSRFRIPSYEDVPDENEEEAEEQIGIVGSDSDTRVTFEETEAVEESRTSNRTAEEEVTTAFRLENSGSLAVRHRDSSIAGLLARLWAEKTADTTLVLHLNSGETLVPSHFAQNASQGNHGLFATEDPSGRLTLMMVAWDSIAHVEVQGVKRLPDWMRE